MIFPVRTAPRPGQQVLPAGLRFGSAVRFIESGKAQAGIVCKASI